MFKRYTKVDPACGMSRNGIRKFIKKHNSIAAKRSKVTIGDKCPQLMEFKLA